MSTSFGAQQISTPAEQLLRGLVQESVDFIGEQAHLDVRRSGTRNTGDFSIDLGPEFAKKPARDLCREVAKRLEYSALIGQATAIPPRIHVRVSQAFLHKVIDHILGDENFGRTCHGDNMRALLVFSTPNANKALHIGHLRNNFLGMALGNIFEAHGYRVTRASVLSDWGIHMAQAAVAYLRWGGGQTPTSTGEKPDRFVGRFYVQFQRESASQEASEEGRSPAPAGIDVEARLFLDSVERGHPEFEQLMRQLADWADEGIRSTYDRIGTQLDHVFRERDTLSLGKLLVSDALRAGHCERREDGSVFIDLSDVGLGQVTLLRHDGTAVVYAHMLANQVHRFTVCPFDRAISLYGDQWRTGTDVMAEILRRLEIPWANRVERVYYGMVSLRGATMRSRSGKAVNADDLLDRARDRLEEALAPHVGAGDTSRGNVAIALAPALLKYHFLRVRRGRRMVFDEDGLWNRDLPAFLKIVRVFHVVDSHAGSANAACDSLDDFEKRLVLALDSFPLVSWLAFAEREPSFLMRLVEEITSAAAMIDFAVADETMIKATALVLRACAELLNLNIVVSDRPRADVDAPSVPEPLIGEEVLAGHE